MSERRNASLQMLTFCTGIYGLCLQTGVGSFMNCVIAMLC